MERKEKEDNRAPASGRTDPSGEDRDYPFLKKEQLKKIRAAVFVILLIAAVLVLVFRDRL